MILVAFRHGLRSSELVDLRWDQIDFTHEVLHVRRAKKGTPATHPIRGDEKPPLRKLQREQDPKSPFGFAILGASSRWGKRTFREFAAPISNGLPCGPLGSGQREQADKLAKPDRGQRVILHPQCAPAKSFERVAANAP